ncbi:hypothetical protein ACJX0J_032892 [Zea mays]
MCLFSLLMHRYNGTNKNITKELKKDLNFSSFLVSSSPSIVKKLHVHIINDHGMIGSQVHATQVYMLMRRWVEAICAILAVQRFTTCWIKILYQFLVYWVGVDATIIHFCVFKILSINNQNLKVNYKICGTIKFKSLTQKD